MTLPLRICIGDGQAKLPVKGDTESAQGWPVWASAGTIGQRSLVLMSGRPSVVRGLFR
jgi:hypothetical protein